jgi:hypothetical protein
MASGRLRARQSAAPLGATRVSPRPFLTRSRMPWPNLHIPPRRCLIPPPPDGIFRNYVAERLRCRRKIDMTPAAQSRDDTPVGGGRDQRDTASHPPNHWV